MSNEGEPAVGLASVLMEENDLCFHDDAHKRLVQQRSLNIIRGIQKDVSMNIPMLSRSESLKLKSAIAMFAELQNSRSPTTRFDDDESAPDLTLSTHFDDDEDLDDFAIIMRKERQIAASQFQLDYTYGSSILVDGCNKNSGHTKDKKTCIWSCDTRSWWCKSSGIMWVAVHGTDSICVVTWDEKLDKTRVDGLLSCKTEMEVLYLFRETLISEIEDLADPTSELNQLYDIDQSIKKPFGVVSTIPGFDKVHEECSHEASSSAKYDEEKAVKFLKRKMKSGSAFTFDETVQTAILAFQKMFHQNFDAKEIRVCAWKDDDVWELSWCEIMEHLAVICGKRAK